ncbi:MULTISPECIES: sugar-transfer associated ATP-grasp domain-containing protein [Oscillospiraceae]|uniref:sugar-transfer associated ATP-grasp domain-containing protein n=1 Tax=Oscillospiraceae TaxID=216572 RepID=UPI001105F529|nr:MULTISPECIES: sugar-transfer associated ATP-grasp domain-containing protein [Oscillospiraceae]
MRSGVRKKWDNLNCTVESMYRKYEYRKKAKIRLKRMHGGYDCTEEYNKIVVPYWKKYGLKPNKMWYQIFWDRNHDNDPRYIPDDLWYGTIVPYFSNTQFRRFGEDKCMHAVWFPDLKRPRTVVMNIAGVFYSPDYLPISEEKAVELCLIESEFLVKPSIDSGEGRLIKFFDKKNINKHEIKKCFSSLGANFIVQEVVNQNSVLCRLNQSSLNTIRVVSFFFKGKVHILSTILRVGAKGSRVDNVGAGGYACVIKTNGELQKKGVNRKAEWVTQTQEGVKFDGIKIPSFERIIEEIKRVHKRMAHFKIIGWDFCIDQEGDPVFIEYNSCPGSNQITCGPTFGDLTEEVLEEIFINKTLKNAQN